MEVRESHLEDITTSLQQAITAQKDKLSDHGKPVSIQIPKGDYSIQTVTIPNKGHLQIQSKDRVRLVYAGKRNRPIFILGENSSLVILEKIEIYYNTNNVQEVAGLMVKCPKSSRVQVSKDVKISLFSLKQ